MDAGDINQRPGKALRRRRPLSAFVRAFAGILRDPDRPAIFDLLFWSILALIYAFRFFGLLDLELRGVGLAPMTVVCAVLVAVWLALPWRPSVSRRRKLAAPAFLLASTAMLFASDLIWALGLYPIAFANAVFLFGLRRGVAYTVATLLALIVISFVRAATNPLGPSDETIVQRFALIGLLTVVCIGLSATVIEARRSRERAETLLGDLEAAHAELQRYAGRVRELTLADERTRIAREIHDSVGHRLTAVKLQAEAAVKMAAKRPEKARYQMELARDLASEAYDEVRRSVRALKPPPAEERSGAGALRALVRSFEGTGFDVRFAVEGEERILSEEAELVLYRALQEGLTNVARHSNARRVRASLVYGDESVRLTVVDDGHGAPEEAEATGGGFGLPALEERVEALGGAFTAGNAPGGGFAVEVELPFGHPFRSLREKP